MHTLLLGDLCNRGDLGGWGVKGTYTDLMLLMLKKKRESWDGAQIYRIQLHHSTQRTCMIPLRSVTASRCLRGETAAEMPLSFLDRGKPKPGKIQRGLDFHHMHCTN